LEGRWARRSEERGGPCALAKSHVTLQNQPPLPNHRAFGRAALRPHRVPWYTQMLLTLSVYMDCKLQLACAYMYICTYLYAHKSCGTTAQGGIMDMLLHQATRTGARYSNLHRHSMPPLDIPRAPPRGRSLCTDQRLSLRPPSLSPLPQPRLVGCSQGRLNRVLRSNLIRRYACLRLPRGWHLTCSHPLGLRLSLRGISRSARPGLPKTAAR
jgi:hypothetical protein